MERSTFIHDFSQRLIKALQDKGYSSSRSKSGIEMSELAKIAGVSYSMARKYVLGAALPDYHLIPKIAHWLNVSPGWLLFGEEHSFSHLKSSTAIEIETELLRYILNKCILLFPPLAEPEKIINYIVGVIYDAAHIEADQHTILKIIDMMLSSAIQLTNINSEKSA